MNAQPLTPHSPPPETAAPVRPLPIEDADALDARLRKIDRQLSTITSLLLQLKNDREEERPWSVDAPPVAELHCRRCGFLLTPGERREGHQCQRRTDDTAGWAAKAKAGIHAQPATRGRPGQEDAQ